MKYFSAQSQVWAHEGVWAAFSAGVREVENSIKPKRVNVGDFVTTFQTLWTYCIWLCSGYKQTRFAFFLASSGFDVRFVVSKSSSFLDYCYLEKS